MHVRSAGISRLRGRLDAGAVGRGHCDQGRLSGTTAETGAPSAGGTASSIVMLISVVLTMGPIVAAVACLLLPNTRSRRAPLPMIPTLLRSSRSA